MTTDPELKRFSASDGLLFIAALLLAIAFSWIAITAAMQRHAGQSLLPVEPFANGGSGVEKGLSTGKRSAPARKTHPRSEAAVVDMEIRY